MVASVTRSSLELNLKVGDVLLVGVVALTVMQLPGVASRCRQLHAYLVRKFCPCPGCRERRKEKHEFSGRI